MICGSFRADEESAKRSELEKTKRELDNQLEELREDLEAEKNARTKAERQRRELGEVEKKKNMIRLRYSPAPRENKLCRFQLVT